MYLGIGILQLVKLKLSCFNFWEHKKYIYINQICELYNGNNTCAIQQPYTLSSFTRGAVDLPLTPSACPVDYQLDLIYIYL